MSSFVSALCTLALLSVFATVSWADPPAGYPSELPFMLVGGPYAGLYVAPWDPGGGYVFEDEAWSFSWFPENADATFYDSPTSAYGSAPVSWSGSAWSFGAMTGSGLWGESSMSVPEPTVGVAAMSFFLCWRRRS